MKGSKDASSSSMSGSNAITGGVSFNENGEVKCQCGKVSIVKKSLTNENPWRRFYSCGNAKWGSCNFFRWYDVEKPHGWQKKALVEARDLIRDQTEELKKLRALVGHESANMRDDIGTRDKNIELLSELERENKNMKDEIRLANEKEKLLRQFVIISWIGFVGVTAVIVNVLK